MGKNSSMLYKYSFSISGIILIIFLFIQKVIPVGIVEKGNQSYFKCDFDRALMAYDEAASYSLESNVINFNKGAAYFRKGDYSKAVNAFSQASASGRDIRFDTYARFNMGNCYFKMAEMQREKNPEKSIELCWKSILLYQDAYDAYPGFWEAAENVEIAKILLKSIMDERKKIRPHAQQQELQQQSISMQQMIRDIQQGNPDKNGEEITMEWISEDEDNILEEEKNSRKRFGHVPEQGGKGEGMDW